MITQPNHKQTQEQNMCWNGHRAWSDDSTLMKNNR